MIIHLYSHSYVTGILTEKFKKVLLLFVEVLVITKNEHIKTYGDVAFNGFQDRFFA